MITLRSTFIFLLLVKSISFHVFIIGDSIDRYTVEDWCDYRGDGKSCSGPGCTFWAEGGDIWARTKYGRDKATTHLRCNMINDSITYIHNYGLSENGPYVIDSGPFPDDPYKGTKVRIAHALDLYFDRIGIPDLVLYHGTEWTLQKLYELNGTSRQRTHGQFDKEFSYEWNSTLIQFEKDLNDRITDVQSNVERNLRKLNYPLSAVNIGTRTAVYSEVRGPLLHAMNEVSRKVAFNRNITLFDIDNEIWGSVNWEYSLEKTRPILRDFIHPIPMYLKAAGEMLLGRFYTRALEIRGIGAERYPSVTFGSSPGVPPSRSVSLIQQDFAYANMSIGISESINSESNYLTRLKLQFQPPSMIYILARSDYVGSVAHIDPPDHHSTLIKIGPISRETLTLLNLGPLDVYFLSSEEFLKIPTASVLVNKCIDILANSTSNATSHTSSGSSDSSCGFETSTQVFVSDNSHLRRVATLESLAALGTSTILTGFSDLILNLLASDSQPLPDIYRNNTLVRWAGSREVYLVVGGYRRLVTGIRVFYNRGWDLNQVIVVSDERDITRIPLGEPLNS